MNFTLLILMFNQCFGNQNKLINQFNRVRQLNPKLSKRVLHVTLSFAKEDNLDQNKLIAISEACAKDLGFESNQFVSLLHKDTGHQHLHIVANRIGFNKKTVSDSDNYKTMANFCRKTELKYNLQQVQNPARYLSREQRNLPRTDSRKKQLSLSIRRAFHQSKSFDYFKALMQSQGYKVIKGRGILFIDDKKVKIKGSDVGYSLQKIETNIAMLNRLSTDKEFFRQLNNRPATAEASPGQINTVTQNEKQHPLQTKTDVNSIKILHDLISPEQIFENVNPLLVKKKKRLKI